MDVRTPIGALHDAFRVSSDRWALASKPVIVYWLMRMPMQATYSGDARTDHPGSPVLSLKVETKASVVSTHADLQAPFSYIQTNLAD